MLLPPLATLFTHEKSQYERIRKIEFLEHSVVAMPPAPSPQTHFPSILSGNGPSSGKPVSALYQVTHMGQPECFPFCQGSRGAQPHCRLCPRADAPPQVLISPPPRPLHPKPQATTVLLSEFDYCRYFISRIIPHSSLFLTY